MAKLQRVKTQFVREHTNMQCDWSAFGAIPGGEGFKLGTARMLDHNCKNADFLMQSCSNPFSRHRDWSTLNPDLGLACPLSLMKPTASLFPLNTGTLEGV